MDVVDPGAMKVQQAVKAPAANQGSMEADGGALDDQEAGKVNSDAVCLVVEREASVG